MYYETFEGGVTAEIYKSFLEDLNKLDDSPKFIIHDGLPSHKANLVKEYVQSTNGKLRTFQLPGYSPELNPEEWVWDNLKKGLGRRAHKNIEDLTSHAIQIMNAIKSDRKLLSSYYEHVYGIQKFNY